MKRRLSLAISVALFVSACGQSSEVPEDVPANLDSGAAADSGAVSDAAGAKDGGFDAGWDDAAAVIEPPRFADWSCPEGWLKKPAFTGEKGVENPPEGVAQFSICEPPESWAPARLRDWDCPSGWSRIPAFTDRDGTENPPAGMEQYSICLPPEVPECPDGEVAFLGETACHPIGTPCPLGDFLDETTIRSLVPGYSGAVVHVKAGAAGGDGSPSSPFGSISDAVAAAAAGDIIALSTGTFAKQVVLDDRLALVGACAGGTRVQASDYDSGAGIIEIAGAAAVANLTVSGPRKGIRILGAAAAAVLTAVEVKDAMSLGISVSGGATARLSGVVVRDTGGDTSDGTRGRGLYAIEGSTVSVSGAVFERNRDAAVLAARSHAAEPLEISLEDVVVRNTESEKASNDFGRGLEIGDGVMATVKRALFDRNRSEGIIAGVSLALADPPVVSLEDVIVRGTRPREKTGTLGNGLAVFDGAKVTGNRVLLEANRTAAIQAYSTSKETVGTAVDLTDAVIRDTLAQENGGLFGVGVDANEGATVTLTRALLDRNRGAGALAETLPGLDFPAALKLSDSVVRDTVPEDAEPRNGYGVAAINSARVTARGLLVERASGAGITAYESEQTGTTIWNPRHSLIRHVRPRPGAPWNPASPTACARNAEPSGRACARLGDRARRGGAFAYVPQPALPAPSLDLSDLVVRDILPQPESLAYGHGIEAYNGASVVLARALVERARKRGIYLYGTAANRPALTAEDLVVRDIEGQASDGTYGNGLEIGAGSATTVRRALFERNRTAGVFAWTLDTRGTVEISDVLVRDTRSQAFDLDHGTGIDIVNGMDVTIERAVVERNHDLGIVAIAAPDAPPPTVAVRDMVVRNTAFAECASVPEGADGSCVRGGVSFGGGTGLGVYEKAVVEVERFVIAGSAQCGVQLAREALITASHGDIARNAIGVNIQIEGYDWTTILSPTVRVHDNDTNVDTQDLPVPEPAPLPEF
jgi:hypothetical protein